MAKEKEDVKIMSLIAYSLWWFTGLIIYYTAKDKTIKFHAARSTIIFGIGTIAIIILGFIPFIGFLLAKLLELILIVAWIIILIKVLENEGKKFEIPVLSQYVDKMAEEWANK